jgi:RHS repeat-associated protein
LVAEYTQNAPANTNPQTVYLTADVLGSPRINTNQKGEVVARHDYLPFGDEIIGLGQRTPEQGYGVNDNVRKKFTGYEKDQETGLDFAQARYYGNGLGRFTSVDPALESIKPTIPQTWNRYTYVLNNPLVLVDPDGLKWGYHDFILNGISYREFHWFDGDVGEYEGNKYEEWKGGEFYIFTNEIAVWFDPNSSRYKEFSLKNLTTGQFGSLLMTQTLGEEFSEEQKNLLSRSFALQIYGENRLKIELPASLMGGVASTVEKGGGILAERAILRFSQRTASRVFQLEGKFAGRAVAEVVEDLRNGILKPSDLPVEVVAGDGVLLIVNTRSALALTRARIPTSQWTLINKTNDPKVLQKIAERLANNQLTAKGTDVIRITGGGKDVSIIK